MGVKLKDLFPSHPCDDEIFRGKTVAIDGFNVAYRYLCALRDSKDGDYLRGPNQQVTSHLMGFLGLISRIYNHGGKAIVVFDGEIHPKKQEEVNRRIATKIAAEKELEEAREKGDWARVKQLLIRTTQFTKEMQQDLKELLLALGIPVIRAPNDGEKFAAALCLAGKADAVVTEDYDALVTGAPMIIRRAGSDKAFYHQLSDLEAHELTQSDLRKIAVLTGTDFHPGIKGLGAKTTLKFLKQQDIKQTFEEADAGHEETRYHKLIRKTEPPMNTEKFVELYEFIKEMPDIGDIPNPPVMYEAAVDMCMEHGLNPGRLPKNKQLD